MPGTPALWTSLSSVSAESSRDGHGVLGQAVSESPRATNVRTLAGCLAAGFLVGNGFGLGVGVGVGVAGGMVWSMPEELASGEGISRGVATASAVGSPPMTTYDGVGSDEP